MRPLLGGDSHSDLPRPLPCLSSGTGRVHPPRAYCSVRQLETPSLQSGRVWLGSADWSASPGEGYMQVLIRTAFAAAATAVLLFVGAGSAQAAVPLTQVFSDPFTNTSSQHKAVVEPDTFAFGSTMVTATQSGRFFDGGASGIGWATLSSTGSVVANGVLPGITVHDGNGGTFDRVSDPSVAFDARHNVWMVSSIPIPASVTVPTVIVNRSADGGLSWGNPVTVATSATADLDKNWTAC